jgi:hypothetical protein
VNSNAASPAGTKLSGKGGGATAKIFSLVNYSENDGGQREKNEYLFLNHPANHALTTQPIFDQFITLE